MEPAAKSPGDNRDNAGGAAMKRSAAGDESSSDDSASPERRDNDRQDPAAMSRSERKRHREKKRRSDVNRGFDDLMNLLIEVDPEVRAEAEERSRRGLWKGSLGGQADNLLSRVDLISRTVSVLRRIHNENEERKALINQLVLQREALRTDFVLGTGNEVSRLGSMLANGHQFLRGRGPAPTSSQSHALSQLISSLPPYNTEPVISQSSLNPLLAARQPLPPPSTLESILGLGRQTLPATAGFAQPQTSQFSVTAEQLLALRILQEQDRQRNASARQRDEQERGGSVGR